MISYQQQAIIGFREEPNFYPGQIAHETLKPIVSGTDWLSPQRVAVVIPMATDTMNARVAMSHFALAMPMFNTYCVLRPVGMEVAAAYNDSIEKLLASPTKRDFEFVLTIETDNLPPAHGVLTLCADLMQHPEYAAIGGLYFTKGKHGVPCIWGNPYRRGDFTPQKPDPEHGIVACNGLSMGFTLFRLSMFKDERLRRPWFYTQRHHERYITQDLWFAADAHKHGYRFAVDCGVKVGHMDSQGVIW